jgi:hypothetical protein
MAEIDLDSLVDLDSLAGQPQQGGILDRGANALRSGTAQIIERTAQTTRMLGGESAANTIQGFAPSVPEGQGGAGTKFIKPGAPWYDYGWEHFGDAVVEQFPQLAQSMAARGAGAAVGSPAGPAGMAAGAFIAPAVLQAYQLVGPIAAERAKNNGRDTPDKSDWAGAIATAAASGALESLGLGGLLKSGSIFARGGREFVTEGSQSVTEQTGETLATEKGLEIDPKQAFGEGLIGAGTGTTVAVPSRAVERFQNRQEAPPKAVQDDDDIRLAQRIRNQTDPEGNDLDLTVRGRGDQYGGVMQAIQDTQAELLAEGRLAQQALTKLARTLDDPQEAQRVLAVFSRKGLNRQDTNPSTDDFNRFQQLFGDTEEGQQLSSIVRQRAKLNKFLQPNATYGPLSKVTRFLDPLEKNASGFQRAVGGIGNFATMGGGILVNRAAGALERLTGNYSPVESYVRSAEGKDVAPIVGDSALDRVEDFKQSKADSQFWENAATEYASRTGQPITADELQKKAKTDAMLARIMANEEKIKNSQMGDENRAAKSARNAQAAESLAATQERRQAAQERMTAARSNQITRGQLDTLRVELAKLNNEIAAGRLQITQASAKYADALALNKINQSNIRSRLMEIAQALAERRLTKTQADEAMQATLAEEATKSNEEVEAAKAEVSNLNAREGSKAPGMDRYGVTPQAVENELAWIRGDDSAFTAVDDYDGNRGTYRAAKGRAAEVARGELRRELSQKGWNIRQINTLVSPLDRMDDPTVLKGKRQDMFDKFIDDLEGLGIDTTPEGERAIRIASALVEAGGHTVPEGMAESQPKADADPALDALVKQVDALTRALTKMQSPTVNVTVNGVPGSAQAATKVVAANENTEAVDPVDPVVEGQEITTPPKAPVEPAKPPVKEGEKQPQTKAYEEKVKEAASGKMKRARGATARVAKAEAQLIRAKELAPRYPEVEAAVESLENAGGVVNRVKAIILGSGTEFHTFLSLSYAYASRYGLTQAEAAPVVREAILGLQEDQTIFTPKAKTLEIGGRKVKSRGKDGKLLSDIQLRFNTDNPFYELLEVSKAHERVGKIPDAATPAPPLSSLNNFRTAISPGIDGFTPEQKAQATPLIDFLNYMRSMGTGLNLSLFNAIQSQLGETNNVSVEDALSPKDSSGRRTDQSAVQAFTLLKQQIPTLNNGILYQEAHADSRGRVYMRNSSGNTQGGDFMKAMTRANYKAAPGENGLSLLWQSWGNLVAADGKASIKDRVNAYIDSVPALLELANNPFPKDGKYPKHIEALFQEGPLQTIALAMDTKDMVDFAKARSKSKVKDVRKLLKDPQVQQDIATNWKTDAVAQFDANNNSFQLFGLFLGDPKVLQATSMAPRPEDTNVAPAERRTADIYVEPAVNAVRNDLMYELGDAIKTEEGKSWLRGVIKNSVSTYVYDSTIGGASNSVLGKLTKNYDLINPKMFTDARKDVKKTSEGTTFSFKDRPYRVVKNGPEWTLQFNADSKWKDAGKFHSEKAAMDYPVLRDFAGTLTGAVRKNVEAMYPNLRKAMGFFRSVSEWGRDNGNRPILYQTPDGVTFSYQSDEVAKFDAMEFKITGTNGKTYSTLVPVVAEKAEAGRGLSANFTHAHDAYVLRESAKASKAKYYNPIHDSHGFHPSEADQGLQSVLGTMAGLLDLPNVFEAMVKLNNIPIITPDQHKPHVPNGPIIGAMYESDFNRLVQQRIALNAAASPRKSKESIEREARKEVRNIIVIPEKGKAGPIDPSQILTAVS